ncbi:uncharacterized protein LOC112087952 [Eutrema salsugineum]|uniref:uncharacterized protein LOC112087952 n=1 Tax=Eutrema salsugineum TaxID=72664 RepID=UPI000CED313D|nr:uncharacterized protein LOC112087952 [Eutrema salsugineum]
MASSSNNNFYENSLDDTFDEFDQTIENVFETAVDAALEYQAPTKAKKKRAYIERQREIGDQQLWNDYFREDATYPPHIFRRRFRMNKPLFMHIVERLSEEVSFFQKKRDATGRYGLSAIQKCTAAIRILAYGYASDAVDEYLRLGETTALRCLENLLKGSSMYSGKNI